MLEILLEVLLELFGGLLSELVGALLRALWRAVTGREPSLPRSWIWLALGGAAFGTLSILLHPQPVGLPRALRIALLVLLPVATGAAATMWALLRGRDEESGHFWRGLAFGAGYVAMRMLVTGIGRIA